MSQDQLTAEYQKWCKDQGYPVLSADELLVEVVDETEEYVVTGENRVWLKDFISRWEKSDEHIHVNEHGEFDKGCICGGGDFYTVDKKVGGDWHEVEPVEGAEWRGWGCISCNRIFSDKGILIAHPAKIAFQQ